MLYSISFQLADEEKAKQVNLKDYSKEIEAAIEDFNTKGREARNKREITKHTITFNTLFIDFESDVELSSPTKSFRYFSKYLIDNEGFDKFVSDGRLFKGVDGKLILDEEADISDEEMLTTLLHWCLSKDVESASEKKRKRVVIDKIKELLKESQV